MATVEEKLDQHILECAALQQEVREELQKNTAAVRQTNNSLVVLQGQFSTHEDIFQLIARLIKIFDWLFKYGRRAALGAATIFFTAWVTVVVQNYIGAENARQAANVAASRADAAAKTSTATLHTLNSIAGASQ